MIGPAEAGMVGSIKATNSSSIPQRLPEALLDGSDECWPSLCLVTAHWFSFVFIYGSILSLLFLLRCLLATYYRRRKYFGAGPGTKHCGFDWSGAVTQLIGALSEVVYCSTPAQTQDRQSRPLT